MHPEDSSVVHESISIHELTIVNHYHPVLLGHINDHDRMEFHHSNPFQRRALGHRCSTGHERSASQCTPEPRAALRTWRQRHHDGCEDAKSGLSARRGSSNWWDQMGDIGRPVDQLVRIQKSKFSNSISNSTSNSISCL